MAVADPPDANVDPTQLTGVFASNPDGWVTAQIGEFPAAISQGPNEHEAWLNVLDAYHDLTHEPTATERLIYRAQAEADRTRDAILGLAAELLPAAERARRAISEALGRQGRDRVH